MDEEAKTALAWVVGGSVAVLAAAAVAWIVFPRARPWIAAAVVLSPIPPVP